MAKVQVLFCSSKVLGLVIEMGFCICLVCLAFLFGHAWPSTCLVGSLIISLVVLGIIRSVWVSKTIWGKLYGPYGVCLGFSLAHVVVKAPVLPSIAVVSDKVLFACFFDVLSCVLCLFVY